MSENRIITLLCKGRRRDKSNRRGEFYLTTLYTYMEIPQKLHCTINILIKKRKKMSSLRNFLHL
jgi:hypothetical protein